LQVAFLMLEPCARKLARTVLRGGSSGNVASLPDNIVVTVVEICGKQVKIGIQAPEDVVILRTEIANQPVKKETSED
jgi:carbon storage regulator CsrA